jgi:hypothetical protein
MEHDTHEMMATGAHSEELNVEQMRKPRYGMPVAHFGRRQGPPDTRDCHPLLHMRVVGHVPGIIEVKELRVP